MQPFNNPMAKIPHNINKSPAHGSPTRSKQSLLPDDRERKNLPQKIRRAANNVGNLTPGETYTTILFCKNTQNTPVTLNLTTNNWNPPNANQYIETSWNYTANTIIQPAEIIPIQFQLTISINITGINNFSFDYIIGVNEHAE
jgi:hypothetical protein